MYRLYASLLMLVLLTACATGPVVQFVTFTPPPRQHTPTAPPPRPSQPAVATAGPTQTPSGLSVGVSLVHLRMFDSRSGWAIGRIAGNPNDLVMRTLNGAERWVRFQPPQPEAQPETGGWSAIPAFLDINHAWVIFTPRIPGGDNAGVVWRTADGGLTWQSSQLPLQDLQVDIFEPAQVGFINAQSGYVFAHLGGGMNHDYVALFTTLDGGVTWRAVVNPTLQNLPMSGSKNGVSMLTTLIGWAAGSYNGVLPELYLYRTVDAGRTWGQVKLPSPADAPDLFKGETVCNADPPRFTGEQGGYLTLQCTLPDGSPKRWLYLTLDGGQSWGAYSLPVPYGNLEFINSSIGWYLGGRTSDFKEGATVYQTYDGGKTWQTNATVWWGGEMEFLNANIGWVLAQTGDARALVRTDDGGFTWKQVQALLLPQ